MKRNRIFFRNVDRNRNFQNFGLKSKLFSEMLPEMEICEILNRNRIFFENVDRNRDFRNWKYEIEFFCENVDRNRNFYNFETKSKFIRKCLPKSRFSKFWTKWNLFEDVDQNRDFRFFLTEIEFYFRKCWPKSRFSKFGAKSNFFSKMLTEI